MIAFTVAVAGTASAQPLPELELDATGTTVSGLSSGAYMAVQFHVTFSRNIAGAGVVAGGPYYCARGSVLTALNQCMQTLPGGPDDAALLQVARSLAEDEKIDALAGLAEDRLYLFSGTSDNTVTPPVMDAARDFYRGAGVAAQNMRYVTDVPAGHAFLAEGAPNSCGVTQPDFINDCGIDQAGDILSWLYGDLNAPRAPDPTHLRVFEQDEFLANSEAHGMDQLGYVYVPETCAAGESCKLHVVFHGCQQTLDQIGDLYVRTTGYNRWAETNDIVVLYPQAHIVSASSTDPLGGNPNGCWDWWGYDDPDYALRSGRQMAAVAGMADKLGAPLIGNPDPDPDPDPDEYCVRHATSNWRHFVEGRAEFCGLFTLCAIGSDEIIGGFFGASILFESPQGEFATTSCQS
ncbi:extracellular catalytic domain type 2 short-chain-length polyhydroxyalkanoate depolymerase [Granulosicoccus sp. 3-233]|uniref:extracellular catalytic domain type 2 short-chain-length polyhydroxyalkanoate depolymerase n=1 Tax=Granulosicoccus sp. 3-233 TaxID=3417969 RepID=UPI003D34AC7B